MSFGFAEVAAWVQAEKEREGIEKNNGGGKSKDEREKDDDTPVHIWVVSKEASGRTHAT